MSVPRTPRAAAALPAVALATALAVALGGTASAGEKRSPNVVRGAAGARLDRALQTATGGGFWGVALVARGGEVLLAKGYGYADYGDRPNLPDSLFEIASVSKQVTATMVLRLEQEGRLSTADPLAKHLPGTPEDKRGITLDHLLHHTAGLAPDLGVPYASPLGREEWVRTVLAPPLAAEPGAAFSYSNVGYALLAAVVEVATGEPFEAAVRKELLARADLRDTGFIGEPRLVASPRVTARLGDGPPDATAARWWYGWGYRGMGGVVTTALDLERWDRALRGDALLAPAAREKLHAPAREGYACGWLVEPTDRGTRRAHHSGGVAGYSCLVSRWLEEDALVVLLSNGRSDLGAAERALAEVLFPPVRIEADLDPRGHTLGRHAAVELSEGLLLGAGRNGEQIEIRLAHGGRILARLRVPRGVATRVAGELEAAAAARAADAGDGDGEAGAVEAGLYLLAYGPSPGLLELRERLEVLVLPLYRGRREDGSEVVDRRPVLVLVDAKRGMWPLMVKMSPAAARALAAELRRAGG